MPNNIVKSFAKESNKSISEVEKLWDKSKEIVKSEYKDVKEDSAEFYKLVTGVLKKQLGINESQEILDELVHLKFRDFIERL